MTVAAPAGVERRVVDTVKWMQDQPSILWTGAEVAALIRVAIYDTSAALNPDWTPDGAR